MIPDTILHYPDGKDAVIDSKVSLTAFVDYQNAETDDARAEALQRHVRSVRQHVAELARKDYSAYIKLPRQALNYVIMFVPNEGALQLALAEAPELWREAFSKGVFITGEQNLTAALRIIQIAWTQMQQAQNQEAIYDTARMLLDRVADFIGHFETVGQEVARCFVLLCQGRRQAEGRAVERGGSCQQTYQVGCQGQCQEGDSRGERTVARSGRDGGDRCQPPGVTLLQL